MKKIKTTICTKKDFDIQWFSGSGAGGQHRNKHQNCVRLRHIPTGFQETCQEFRERKRNLQSAFRKLVPRIVEEYRKTLRHEGIEPSVETVRTYHAVDNRVKDHKSGMQMEYSEVVERGNLGPMIDARREAFYGEDL